jgi:hypothetical protein
MKVGRSRSHETLSVGQGNRIWVDWASWFETPRQLTRLLTMRVFLRNATLIPRRRGHPGEPSYSEAVANGAVEQAPSRGMVMGIDG